MWTVLTRIFGGQSNEQAVVPHSGCGHEELLEEHRLPQPKLTQVEAVSEATDIKFKPVGDMDDSYDTKQAKQRASVKWLLSKAFNNKVPPNLKEPFYRDHENQEHLKPQILGALSTAELYCLALGNIYSDPNYHNLNHWAILQTLARKGVYANEPSDAQLTETTLIQTNPLRMTAHMAVIESIMLLYAREVVSSDRVQSAVQRFIPNAPTPLPTNHEDGLILWVNESVKALLRRIKLEVEEGDDGKGKRALNGSGSEVRIPDISVVQELRDLCDGVALAALISYYCPEDLPWQDIRSGARLPSVAGSLHNLGLVQTFCSKCMPATVFHMLPEDVTYMRGSMKQNLVVFLADMFNLLEIHPLHCVRCPGMDKTSTEHEVRHRMNDPLFTDDLDKCGPCCVFINSQGFPARNAHGVVHKRNLPTNVMMPIPDLRSGLEELSTTSSFQVPRPATAHGMPMQQQLLRKTHNQSSVSEMSEDSLYRPASSTPLSAAVAAPSPSSSTEHDNSASFVVHRGRNVPTLSSMQQHGYADTDSGNGSVTPPVVKGGGGSSDSRVAGRPSNWEEHRKSTFAGRRSRRNSTSDDSQLTIENFGGSQDNLNFIGRNPDKEVGTHVGRRISAPAMPSSPIIIQPSPVRSSIQDARGSLQLGYGDDDTNNVASHNVVPLPAYRNIQTNQQQQQQPTNNGYTAAGSWSGLRRQTSNDDLSGGLGGSHNERQLSEKGVMMELMDGRDMGVGVDESRLGGVQLVYMQHNNSDDPSNQYQPSSPSKSSFLTRSNSATNGGSSDRKTTTFATLPSTTTTWQQLQQQGGSGGGGDGLDQQYMQQHSHGGIMSRSDEGTAGEVNNSGTGGGGAAQLNDIRLRMEEKRRDIENTKRRYEMDANRQRQKVGKAAFLQAVTNKGKVSGSNSSPPDCMVDSLMTSVTTTSSAPSSPTNNGAAAFAQPDRPHTAHQDIPDHMEQKWMDHNGSYSDRRLADMENMEKYQHSISQMNSSLVDMQADIQRLANQHNQIQLAQLAHKQQQQIYQQQQNYRPPAQMHEYQSPYSSQFNTQSGAGIYNPLQSSASAPHIPQSLYQQQQQFFLHSGGTSGDAQQSPPPVVVAPMVPQRRTWAQQPPTQLAHLQHQPQLADVYSQQQPQPEMRTWGGSKSQLSGSPGAGSRGFMLHDNTGDRYSNIDSNRYTNGSTPTNTITGFSLSSKHSINSAASNHQLPSMTTNNSASVQSSPGASPQHQRQHRQLSQLMAGATAPTSNSQPVSLQQMDNVMPPQRPERRSSATTVMHAPIPAPSVDDMEPQDISFIAGVVGGHQGDGDGLADGLSRLNITSGTRTYRIPSPTRPFLSRGSSHYASPPPSTSMDSSSDPPSTSADTIATKGFYISFDDEQPPKRPKPPLRTKKMIIAGSIGGASGGGNEKKHREQQEDEKETYEREREYQEKMERRRQLERELNEERAKRDMHDDQRQRELPGQMGQRHQATTSQERERDRVNAASSIIIGNELNNPNPEVLDELERKKEKILMLSLQRRQQQEETKERKEAEACARREQDKAKEEERERKKEEQIQRRAVILEQYKLKKAFEEAEREGKDLDKGMLNSLKPTPKMRPKPSIARPRPKTIHIDSGSVEMAEGMLQPSRGKKGSTSNLTAASSYNPSSMKRDYYRGSQDSLASTGLIYKDSPDDSRGMSPSSASAATGGHHTLGRRSSYKTSRDPSPAQTRGRSKYSTYQNFKGRKSNSLMNLYGSSTDQDSMAYRYGDTDSGLGRATPPRRAASPGMGPGAAMRHLPSPSGPGSLPGGLMTKQRRLFDDGSSDISSNASSMMDYNGPRLYKQPATKSNRGIMLNAVEYCVFPGVVNKEAKSRVLEEISRSESKHFLILFRDAGCQFRALYSYCPDREEIAKLYGTGPKLVNDRMFDKFFKYNSGGKCFSQVHTKHLTVTIDAFTIHNSLWQGKKVNLPNKKDMVLVI